MQEDERRILRRGGRPHLFEPLTLRSVVLPNRIMLSPMCQYCAKDGLVNDWHFVHLGTRAVGGAGVVCVEATHVEPRGRITPWCLGLWNDRQGNKLKELVSFIRQQGSVPAIQIGHAGRKASVNRPWEGTKPLPKAEGGWDVIAPSALRYSEKYPLPGAMDLEQIHKVMEAMQDAARRARDACFQILEIHAAHGYLLHQFLSPVSNKRRDSYGGSWENRIRFLLETIEAVRVEWPDDLPLFVRLSCTDWVEEGWTLDDSLKLSRELKGGGLVDLVDCSSGGNHPHRIRFYPGYQVPFAEGLRQHSGLPTGAGGLIHNPDMAEEIVANKRADLVILGRAMLNDPYWPLHAARALGWQECPWPHQYERGNIFFS